MSLANFFGKKIVQHFIGSDVLSAQEDYKNNKVSKKLIKCSSYLCEVEWIQEELKEIEIDAKIVPIMAYTQKKKAKEFKEFSVLTYMGEGKEEFYGIKDFVFLAQSFPEVDFKIAGIESYKNLPENIKCLGWINMTKELQKCTVFIRNAKHDGLGFTVIEALSLGRIVFYNYKFPYVNYYKNRESLSYQLNEIKNLFNIDKLKVNQKAMEFVTKEFNKEYVLSTLVKSIIK